LTVYLDLAWVLLYVHQAVVTMRANGAAKRHASTIYQERQMKLIKSMVFMMVATTALGIWITAIALGA
jgi:F0F1-type ATP synthase assembly protein I